MKIGSASHIGKVRTINQDSYVIGKSSQPFFCIVADGMGGHNAGEIASRMAAEEISGHIEQHIDDCQTPQALINLLCRAFEAANQKVFQASWALEGCMGMGTTATVAVVSEGVLTIAHVGDSRAYLLEDTLKQLTFDHTVVANLLQSGELTEQQAKTDSRRHMITRAIGTEHTIEVDTYTFDYSGQVVLLCSDGLYNEVSAEEIVQVLTQSIDLQAAADKLVDMANLAGGNDNITVVAFQIGHDESA